MSDQSRGPGWWQATDGEWYPPAPAGGGPASQPPPPPSPNGGGTPGWVWLVVLVGGFVALVIFGLVFGLFVGDDGGDDSESSAAEAARAAIDEGDELGDCPFGPTDDLVAALPDDLPLADGFERTDNDGQVFFGGEVDIVYCPIFPEDFNDGPIEEIRVDVSPSGQVDVDQYLEEEWSGAEDAEVNAAEGFDGGDVSEACWPGFNGFRQCGVFWQGDDLFVAVVPSGEADVEPEDTMAMAEAMVPLVVERLAQASD